VNFAIKNGMEVVIPPKKNRLVQREYDEYLYKIRHLVENAFFTPETLARYRNALFEKHR